jgi:YVTN family beta-propeller protein
MDIDAKRNRLYVTIENPDGLVAIDLATRKVLRKYDVGGEDPHMVLLSASGDHAYVSNTKSGTIGVVELASGKVKTIKTDARPQGAVRSHDGKLIYMTNSDGNSISVIDVSKNERVGTIATGKGPGRIALTPDGKTLIYNLQPGEAVGFADVASRKETKVVPIGGKPLSLTTSADGKWAYLGIQEQDRVVVVSVVERMVAKVIATPKGAGPDPALPLY